MKFALLCYRLGVKKGNGTIFYSIGLLWVTLDMRLYLQQLHGLAVLLLTTQLSHMDENWLRVSRVL